MFKSIRPGSVKSGFTVVGVFNDSTDLPKAASAVDQHDALAHARKRPGFKADAGEFQIVNDDFALIGLGAKKELTGAKLRTVGARIAKGLDRVGPKAARLVLGEAIAETSIEPGAAGQCVGEGMGLANWRVDFFDGSATRRESAKPALTIDASQKAFRGGLEVGLMLADSTNYARKLAATPPNICNPVWLASESRKLAKQVGLTCKVITFEQAKKLGMGGLVNVGRASHTKPCMIILEYKPAKAATSAKPIALVGKTITYDTGGYSLKISNGMKGMKYDKNGGMAVLGAMHAIGTMKPKTPVVAFLPAAENMVGGDAYRPDDIITMYNGVTVEVTNTDAEGRLVMADALAYACKEYKPGAIVDMATLTGGVVVALGEWCAGLWCNDDDLRAKIDRASEATGERVWRLPLWTEHRDFMRSKHADLWNSGPKRDGHPIQGAAFLSYFVDEKTPWAHIDIAGTSNVDGDSDLYVSGPTGYGVRLLAQFVEEFGKRK